MRVVLVQMSSVDDLQVNLTGLQSQICEAKELGAGLVCLPENFAFFGNREKKLQLKSQISEEVVRKLSAWSVEYGIHILAGGYAHYAQNNRFFNRASLFNNRGKIIWEYDKIHLFDFDRVDEYTYRESDEFLPGEIVPPYFEINSIRFNAAICYDLRFPELFRKMSAGSLDVLILPAAFTKTTGRLHWEALLRARAIENVCQVLAVAQTGRHFDGRETWGHTCAISAAGEVMKSLGSEPGLLITDIDLQEIKETRNRFPSLSHRRL